MTRQQSREDAQTPIYTTTLCVGRLTVRSNLDLTPFSSITTTESVQERTHQEQESSALITRLENGKFRVSRSVTAKRPDSHAIQYTYATAETTLILVLHKRHELRLSNIIEDRRLKGKGIISFQKSLAWMI